MTGKERIYSAMEFTTPDCLPFISDSPQDETDLKMVEWNEIVPWKNWTNWKEPLFDHWGCGWTRTNPYDMGQVTIHPLEDWDDLENYKWPDPNDPKFYEGMEERFIGTEGKFVQTHIFMLIFERMQSLRGFENALTDLYIEPEKAENLIDRLVDFDIAVIRNIAERFPGKIDGLGFSDDWGSETGLMINPELWREFFKPRYKKIFDECKKVGWKVYMHSCGKINDIIGDLIEIGVNALNLQQPTVLGIEEIGEKYAGKVCFSSLCDIQKTLPLKGRKEITEEVKRLLHCWGTPQGGFIFANDDSNNDALAITPDKMNWMKEAFYKFDPWKNGSWGETK